MFEEETILAPQRPETWHFFLIGNSWEFKMATRMGQ